MQKKFTLYLFLLFLITSLLKAQPRNTDYFEPTPGSFNNQIFPALSNSNSSVKQLILNNKKGISLAIDPYKQANLTKYISSGDSIDYNYVTWESERRFWIAAGELAIVQFIPFALAKWGRKWEDPADNWANVSTETWWRNISYGWEYDGDAFLTNYFAHPYHGNLYFNVGRTNGYKQTAITFGNLQPGLLPEACYGNILVKLFDRHLMTGLIQPLTELLWAKFCIDYRLCLPTTLLLVLTEF
jgi:hypothetical protein